MATNVLFDAVSEAMENGSSLDRLEARGTLRLALKSAGLEADTTTPEQMRVVLQRVLPTELGARGITEADSLAASLLEVVKSVEEAGGLTISDAPEDVFLRTRAGAA